MKSKDKVVYRYKARWFDGGSLTNYSNKFDTLKEAKYWFSKFGVKLERMFKRKLVLIKTINKN